MINTDDTEALKRYTIYAPPQHKDGLVHATKEKAEKKKDRFDGKTTGTGNAMPVQ